MTSNPDVFNPVQYSLEECAFLLENLGKPTVVALQNVPKEVIVKAVRPIIERVNELEELKKHTKRSWVGVEAIKARIQIYLDNQAKWVADKKRFPKAPRFPTMFSYDAKNKPHRGGPGSDSGQVRTFFDANGQRHEFALDLLENKETGGWAPEWANEAAEVINTKGITEDTANHRLECPVCKHTETYNSESRSSYNAARGRISKHLRNETKDAELHREVYTNEFGS